MKVQIKRIYDEPDGGDGLRVLVDRLWPRGLKKEEAVMDRWLKEVAPSPALRKWYGHEPAKFEAFAERYRQELVDEAHASAWAELQGLYRDGPITLMTASRLLDHSGAAVLARLLAASSG